MPSCEKCWHDASGDALMYERLLDSRKGEFACTPEQQAGRFAVQCPECGRATIHQITGTPMCGCPDTASGEQK